MGPSRVEMVPRAAVGSSDELARRVSTGGDVPVLPGAEPFSHDASAGDVGVLVSHGFTGTPQSMRPWAEHLAAAGFSVRLPRLPGHGTTWQEMTRRRSEEWYPAVAASLTELTTRCSKVVVAGLSMGGTLVTRLAEERPADVS